MAAIPETNPIPGSSGLGGGVGLEHVQPRLVGRGAMHLLRSNSARMVSNGANSGKLVIVKYAIFLPQNDGPNYAIPTGAQFRFYYSNSRSAAIMTFDPAFMGEASGTDGHIIYANDVQIDSAPRHVNLTITGGSGELSGGSGGMHVRIVYDLIDLPD